MMTLRRSAAAFVFLLMLAVMGGVLHAQQVGTTVTWRCTEYFLWWDQGGKSDFVTNDGTYPGWYSWPFWYECVWLYQCTTTFEDGFYTTYCN